MVPSLVIWFMLADVNLMHTRIRRETAVFTSIGGAGLQLLDETPLKITPKKYFLWKGIVNVDHLN